MRQKLAQFTWRQWLLPRFIDGIGLLIYLVVLGVHGYLVWSGDTSHAYFWLRLGFVLGIAMFLLALDRLEYLYYDDQPPWRHAGALMIARIAAIWLALLSDGMGEAWRGLFFGLVVFGVLFVVGSSYNLTGVVWLVELLDRFEALDRLGRFRANESVFNALLILGLFLLGWVGHLVRHERIDRRRAEALLGELEESHRQLQAYAERVAELATTEERNRLARDIHDSLGHYLSVINVQLEKAIAFRGINPAMADQAVRDSKRLASEALQDVRRSVGTLRSTPEPFLLAQSLRELASNARTGLFSIDLDISGDESGYSQQSLLALYRAAQEGLTNIQKHAQASLVTLRLRLDDREAILSIVDNGHGFDPALARDGYGLQGVRERLELLRGSLKLESVPGQGTTLLINVPKNSLALEGDVL